MNWIKLSERDPPLDKEVFVWACQGAVVVKLAQTKDDIKIWQMWHFIGYLEYEKVTHWMEIVPPEGL